MLHRIEIHLIQGGFAFGALLFEDGSAEPIQIPIAAYQSLCDRNFFAFPADLPPDAEEPINHSEVWFTPQTLEVARLEEGSGQRVF